MVSTLVRRIGVVGAMTLAGAGVAAGSAFAAVGDLPPLQGLPGDLSLGGLPTGGLGNLPTGGLGNLPTGGLGNLPGVGGILGDVLGGGQQTHSQTPPPRHQPSRSWYPSHHSQAPRHVDCGCHQAPPPPHHCAPVHHCPPAPHHCPPPAPHHHHHNHQQHHHR